MASHLIIGLGGTGGKVIREFRKRIYTEFRSNEPGHGVHVDYVYVDSSLEDLNNTEQWKVMGKGVHLGNAQKVNINGISSVVLDQVKRYPGLENFLSPEDVQLIRSDKQMAALIGAGIGGQRRRLGRMLLANNLSDKSNKANFENTVRGAVKRLQDAAGDEDVTFHICAGLAGGTGSGSIVDAIAQIRTWFPYKKNNNAFKMRLMLYVPEMTLVKQDNDSGYYQANGYAALTELNAMSVDFYRPVDITGQKDLFTGEAQRLLETQDAFEACYLYTNVNEAGKTLDLGQALPSVVADFLYQSTVAAEIGGGQGKMARLVGCENDGAAPEEDENHVGTRSRKFLSFGITRISYPESEVREFVTYSYATQAALQLTYNYWLEGQGYGERTLDEVGSGYTEEIKAPKNRGPLMLDNAHLMLSAAIIDNDSTKRWRDLDETWTSRAAREVEDITKSVEDKKQWVNVLTDRCKVFFERDFRNQGVKEFYKNQQKELKAYAKYIRRHIESKLFTDWSTGQKSMLEIEKYLTILMQDCNERVTKFNSQKSSLANEELPRCTQEMKDAKMEYDNIGWLRDTVTGASGRVLGKYQTAICNYYTAATRIEAYEYARTLLQEIVLELSSMLEGVKAFEGLLGDITKEATRQAGSKCKTNEAEDDANIKKYDPEKVRMIVRQYTSNKDYQEKTAQQVRSALIAQLGEDGERSFANLYDKVDYNAASDTILDICTEQAVSAMEDTAKSDPMSKMVGVNILEKLKQELNTPEKIEAFVKHITALSRSYVQFNDEETTQRTTGAMQTMVQLCIPEADQSTAAFRQQLINAFKNEDSSFDEKQDVSVNYKSNEIVCISAKSGFPLRYLQNLPTLREKYNRLLADPKGDFNRLLLHTESFAKPLPSLYDLSGAEVRQLVFKPLMLAYTLGMIEDKEDINGRHFSAIRTKDEFGDDAWVELGKDFALVWEALSNDTKKATDLMAEVEKKLKTDARTNDQKAALKPLLGRVLKTHVMNSLCEGNEFHKDFAKYRALAKEILDNELKEL